MPLNVPLNETHKTTWRGLLWESVPNLNIFFEQDPKLILSLLTYSMQPSKWVTLRIINCWNYYHKSHLHTYSHIHSDKNDVDNRYYDLNCSDDWYFRILNVTHIESYIELLSGHIKILKSIVIDIKLTLTAIRTYLPFHKSRKDLQY